MATSAQPSPTKEGSAAEQLANSSGSRIVPFVVITSGGGEFRGASRSLAPLYLSDREQRLFEDA